MAISFDETIRKLLTGVIVSWPAYEDRKGGGITLNTAGKRRLFEFLLSADAASVAEGNEKLFPGLIAAWKNDSLDPATMQVPSATSGAATPFRLTEVRALGFGGLNFDTKTEFVFDVGGESWCLEGQNGYGKTSLASAILWAITGRRIRENAGPMVDDGS